MATLEVHDGLGRVRRVVVSREQTVLFGSSPKCDIVLDDPQVLPFHGRLRWKQDRFKVDASPDAEFIELNGHRMASASFRQGDEIQAGACRIFLINDDEDPPQDAVRPHDDKTRIQPSPFVQAPAPRPRPDATLVRPKPGRGRKPDLEKPDWLKDLEVAPRRRSSSRGVPRRPPVWPSRLPLDRANRPRQGRGGPREAGGG